jgi:excisionase family DNA binding protein
MVIGKDEEHDVKDRYTLSVKETRKALGLGRTTIYKLLAMGQLQRVKIRGRTLVTVQSIELLVEQAVNRGAN